MKNYIIIICLCSFTLLLAAISNSDEASGKQYALKENYRGLDIKIEGIFLTTDPAKGNVIANIPIRIKNNTGKAFTFQSLELDCNGEKVSGKIRDDYISGEIKSGTNKEDVITMEINLYDIEAIDSLDYMCKIHDLKTNDSKTFSISEKFSVG